MQENIHTDLDILIRARYPIIWAESFEEQRVINIVESIIGPQESLPEKDQKMIYIWSGTTGLTDIDGNPLKEGSEDPLVAMDTIEEIDKKIIIIFKDLHRYIEDIMVYRKLRDLHQNLKTTHKTIIIISPVLNIPIELQKVITVVSLPLPGVDELDTVMEGVISAADSFAQQNNNTEQIEIFKLIRDELKTTRDTILNAGLGLTLDEFENVVARSIVEHKEVKLETIIGEKEQIIKKSGILEFYTHPESMDNVGGLEYLKEWIHLRKLAYSPEANEFGLKLPKGVFLAGPPGTGKSLTAKVIANHLEMPLLRLDVSKIFGQFVGQSEQNMSQALKTAEAVAPSVLFIDEVEKALSGAQGSSGDSGVTQRIFGTLLTFLQEHESPVFTCVTCNNPLSIPPEFLRAGRFDQVFMLDLPNETERQDIFRIHINKIDRDPDTFDIPEFARVTDGFSGAEIEQTVHDAMYGAFFEKHELDDTSIQNAIRTTIPLSQKRKSEIDSLRQWGTLNAISASKQDNVISTSPSERRLEL